jgi:hypothetical protein
MDPRENAPSSPQIADRGAAQVRAQVDHADQFGPAAVEPEPV